MSKQKFNIIMIFFRALLEFEDTCDTKSNSTKCAVVPNGLNGTLFLLF
jgi:hypothetical protein